VAKDDKENYIMAKKDEVTEYKEIIEWILDSVVLADNGYLYITNGLMSEDWVRTIKAKVKAIDKEDKRRTKEVRKKLKELEEAGRKMGMF
jgi:hypothetical protein